MKNLKSIFLTIGLILSMALPSFAIRKAEVVTSNYHNGIGIFISATAVTGLVSTTDTLVWSVDSLKGFPTTLLRPAKDFTSRGFFDIVPDSIGLVVRISADASDAADLTLQLETSMDNGSTYQTTPTGAVCTASDNDAVQAMGAVSWAICRATFPYFPNTLARIKGWVSTATDSVYVYPGTRIWAFNK